MELIDKSAVVAEVTRLKVQYDCGWNCALDKVLEHIDDLEVKEVDLEQPEPYKLDIEEIIEQTYHDRSVADTSDMDHVDYENISRYFFELGLKQSSSDEYKIGESEIYLDDDGGEPPYDGEQWLDISCMEYAIPYDKFKVGDKIEIVIRKIKKGE